MRPYLWFVLLFASLNGLVFAQDGHRPPRGDRMAAGAEARANALVGQQVLLARLLRNPEWFREAGITDTQAETLRARLREQDEQMVALRDAMQIAGRRQADLLAAPEMDEDALMASVDDLGRIQTEIARQRMRGLLAVREILSAEQIEQARALVQQRMQRRRRAGSGDQEAGQNAAGREQRRQQERPAGVRQRGARQRE